MDPTSPRRPVSPTFSSPSVYSRAHTHIGPASPSNSSILSHYPNPIATRTRLATRLQHMATLADGEDSDEDVGIAHGPRLTKYADLPPDDVAGNGSPGNSVASFARNVTRKATKRWEGSATTPGGLGLGLDFSISGGGIPFLHSPNPSEVSLVSGTGSTRSAKTATLSAGAALQGAESFLSSFSGQSIASSSHSSATGSTGDDNSLIITPNGITTTYKAPPSLHHGTLTPHTTPTPTPHKGAITPLLAAAPSSLSTPASTQKSPTPPRANLEPSPFSLSPHPASEAWKATDRPLLSSGSPGFGLISLEVAQERERERAVRKAAVTTTPTVTRGILKSRKKSMATAELATLANDPTHPGSPPKLKGKKSLMKLFKGHGTTPSMSGKATLKIGEPMPMTMVPPLPPLPAVGDTPKSTAWNEDGVGIAVWPKSAGTEMLGPKLELRPVSMSFARGLPTDYLANLDDEDPPELPPFASHRARRSSRGASLSSPSSTLAVGREWSRPTSIATTNTASDTSSGRIGIATSFMPDLPPTSFAAADGASTTASMGSAASTKSAAAASVAATSDDPIEHVSLQIANARKAWRVQISELSSQVRELREELEAARGAQGKAGAESKGCKRCQCPCTIPSPRGGRLSTISASPSSKTGGQGTLRDVIAEMRRDTEDGEKRGRGVMDRGRVKTGGARGVFGSGSLYERE